MAGAARPRGRRFPSRGSLQGERARPAENYMDQQQQCDSAGGRAGRLGAAWAGCAGLIVAAGVFGALRVVWLVSGPPASASAAEVRAFVPAAAETGGDLGGEMGGE